MDSAGGAHDDLVPEALSTGFDSAANRSDRVWGGVFMLLSAVLGLVSAVLGLVSMLLWCWIGDG